MKPQLIKKFTVILPSQPKPQTETKIQMNLLLIVHHDVSTDPGLYVKDISGGLNHNFNKFEINWNFTAISPKTQKIRKIGLRFDLIKEWNKWIN